LATFCLLHGNWHEGSCWQPLIDCLEVRGHKAVAPDLPFDDPETTYADRIRPALEALENVSGPVVVVGHSMASGYAPLVAVEHPGALLVHTRRRLPRCTGGFQPTRRERSQAACIPARRRLTTIRCRAILTSRPL
jgi:pimeloyl-ACP methyl ester carboxylesterase